MTDWSQPNPPPEQQPPPSPYGPPSTAPGYAPGWQPEVGATLAEWWRRLLAIILDVLILIIPNAIITSLFGLTAIEIDSVTDELTIDFGALAASSLVTLIIFSVYSGILEGGRHGASVGKMALRIQVRDADTGGPIGFGRAAVRRLIYQALLDAFVIPGVINGLSPLWDRRRQAWHDKAVNSVVVRRR